MSDILPSELWTEILVLLPVRSLLTLKCVSKSFLCLVQNPNFANLHFSRFNSLNSESNDSDLLLLERSVSFTVCRGDTSTKKLEFTISIDGGDDVVGYVNGLLWLHRFNSAIKDMLLCNPSIRKCLLIPTSPASHLGRTDVGFGYDPLSDDYKAVVIVHIGSDEYNFDFLSCTLVEVYSLKMGSWRSIGIDLVSGEWHLGKSVYANGAVHWMAGRYRGENFLGSKLHDFSHVISFDLGTEVFSYRDLPKTDVDEAYGCPLKLPLSIHGSLAVLYLSWGYICAWVMEEKGWTQEYMIESSSMFYDYLSNWNYNIAERINNAVFCEKSSELVIAADKEGIISYNIKTMAYKIRHCCVTYIGKYVENLLWKELLPQP